MQLRRLAGGTSTIVDVRRLKVKASPSLANSKLIILFRRITTAAVDVSSISFYACNNASLP